MNRLVIHCLLMMFACCISTAVPGTASGAAGTDANVQIKLHDLPLQDQDGRTLRFKSDVIGDRLVAITFTYTTCTTICPILDAVLQKLQGKLGSRLGKDVFLITMSIDPVNDIPARLKAHANKLGARPGWTFLTGRKADVDKVLVGLDMYAPDILNHPPSIIIGNGKTGTWRRFYGFPSADKIIAGLNDLEPARHK